jgi:hypothetical protein
MVYLLILLTWALFSACSSQNQEGIPPQTESPSPANQPPASSPTVYGDSGLIQKYLVQINPYIQEVGKIQLEVDKVVGSSDKATGANLAPVMSKLIPRLEVAHSEFEQIAPPPLLAQFHSDIKNLMALRLDAYKSTIRGWSIEEKTGDAKVYQEAELKLKQANELIAKLNGEMAKINQALATTLTAPQTASP